ncbi:MFS transporter [uncultured Sulfitobacter sp.]|uniref:MFS transporter n=1 Tax=uncultured Sulfitobacter sp. TaxID=191468 RepID=UPI0030D77394|tara:strand:- start:267710 stop:268924 length:1215 start_codon:yes stop_codon:yes gene_type:complete
MTPVRQLTRAAYGIHIADQIALVSVPLVAALIFDAPAETIGLLVACQSTAHLLGSIPFGILVDTYQQRTLAIAATLLSLVGFSGAAIAVAFGSLFWFGLFVVLSGFGIVLFMLTTLSIIPKTVAPKDLGTANAGIELPRALASFAVPLSVGIAISYMSAGWLFPLAAVGAAAACIFAVQLPRFEITPTTATETVFSRVLEGGKYVVGHGLLRAILLCAIFWNFAFSALLVTMVPLIRDVYLIGAGTFGIALAAFGAGAIMGSWISRRYGARIQPNIVLLFGPGISVVAPIILYLVPAQGSLLPICAAFFIIGFGPSMWLIAQNSVRQIVSPNHMLGRVNAVIQTAIYGVRPLAAVLAGAFVGSSSPQAGLVLVFVAFVLSFLAATVSGLRNVKSYEDLRSAVKA